MLHGGYWEGLKEYYEKEYNGIMAGKFATKYAEEISERGSSFLNYDRPFDPDEVYSWIRGTQEDDGYQNNPDSSELIKQFPNLYYYESYTEEIAAYFLHESIDLFKAELGKSNQEYIDEAIRLDWTEMIEEIPTVKEIFLF
jgi:hypothetical protein